MESCACTGIRYCKICKEDRSLKVNLYEVDPSQDVGAERILTFGEDELESTGFEGVRVIEGFLSEEEESGIVENMDRWEWRVSQSG